MDFEWRGQKGQRDFDGVATKVAASCERDTAFRGDTAMDVLGRYGRRAGEEDDQNGARDPDRLRSAHPLGGRRERLPTPLQGHPAASQKL